MKNLPFVTHRNVVQMERKDRDVQITRMIESKAMIDQDALADQVSDVELVQIDQDVQKEEVQTNLDALQGLLPILPDLGLLGTRRAAVNRRLDLVGTHETIGNSLREIVFRILEYPFGFGSLG